MNMDTKKELNHYVGYFERLDVKGVDTVCFKCKDKKSTDEWYIDLYYRRIIKKYPNTICGTCLPPRKEFYNKMEADGVDILASIKNKKKTYKRKPETNFFIDPGIKKQPNTEDIRID